MEKEDLQFCHSNIKKILGSLTIHEEFYSIKKIKTTPNHYIHSIHFSKIEQEKDNVLVILHGFFASSISQFKLVKLLMDFYYVVVLDIPGFGLSSRLSNTPKSNPEWIYYFCKNLNLFFKNCQIEKMILAGHSMGGYIASHYMEKYPDQITSLYLISPGGLNYPFPTAKTKITNHIDKNVNVFLRSTAKKVISNIFEKKVKFVTLCKLNKRNLHMIVVYLVYFVLIYFRIITLLQE